MSSGQKSLTSYFKRKENEEGSADNVTKKGKMEGDFNNIMNDDDTNVQTLSNNELSSDTRSITNDTPVSTIKVNDNKKRTYQKWYSDSFSWLLYEPDEGGFCRICRDYWKPTTPNFSEIMTRTRGAFIIQPFINWKHAPGPNGSLQKHQDSHYHKISLENLLFRQQEGSVLQQLFNVSESERLENRERFADILDAAYFLFKQELPHTTLYSPLLELLTKTDHSQKLSLFFDKCKKNASYDSTSTVTELLESISEIIDERLLSKIRKSRIISIMADEGTDINHYQNLSICIRYCDEDTGE